MSFNIYTINAIEYLLNNDSEDIIYFHNDEYVKISVTDFLKENPHLTKSDFDFFKKCSNELFQEEARNNNRARKKRNHLSKVLETSQYFSTKSLEDTLIDEETASIIYNLIMHSELTKIQQRRFYKYYFEDKTLREIGLEENVHFTAVKLSLDASKKKLKKFYQEKYNII